MKRTLNLNIFLAIAIVFICLNGYAAQSNNVVVAKDGSGQFTTVQAAINAVPNGNRTIFNIYIKRGRYNEQVYIPAGKNCIKLTGESPAETEIVFGDGKGGTTTFTIDANDITLVNLTLENLQGRLGDGPQSLAIKTNGDRIALISCRLISGQDTVYVNKAGTRVYFNNCYIDGNTDFIYGGAIALFERCVIYPRDRVDFGKGGYITAANTPVDQVYGLVFRNCIIPDNHGITKYSLGRPWQNDATVIPKGRIRAGNKTVFLNTQFGQSILPARWTLWDAGTETDKIIYGEYQSMDLKGKKLDLSSRVSWSKDLDVTEAAPYLNNQTLFGDWNPGYGPIKSVLPLTITNFVARYQNNQASIQFNASWPVDGVTYTLYKTDDANKTFKEIAHQSAKTGNVVAYQFADDLPLDGQNLYYLVKASKGKQTLSSDTLLVNTDKILKPKSRK